MKIRERLRVMRIAGFTVAVVFAQLATVFLCLAIISFRETGYRTVPAWFVVLLYGAVAGIGLNLCLKHFRLQPITATLRSKLQRDSGPYQGKHMSAHCLKVERQAILAHMQARRERFRRRRL